MKQIKLFFVVVAILTLLLVSGCSSPNENGTQTSDKTEETESVMEDKTQSSGIPKTFATLQEAFDSGLSLKCESKTENTEIIYYVANGNIRSQVSTQEIVANSIIKKSNDVYSWTNNSSVVTMSGSSADTLRDALLRTPLLYIPCTEQSLPNSVFEAP